MGKMNKSDGKPRVSIGMPVYNGGDLLKLAIASLLAPEYGDFEFVICDNASLPTEQKSFAGVMHHMIPGLFITDVTRNYG